MTKEEAIKHFGSKGALAKACGVTPGAVSQWEKIPQGQQYKLQILTGGALKADEPKAKEAA